MQKVVRIRMAGRLSLHNLVGLLWHPIASISSSVCLLRLRTCGERLLG